MPVCPKCQIEYKEGLKFCGECGATLISKEESISTPEKRGAEISEKPLVCPNCHLAYEFGEVCIQCGSPLGSKPQEPPPYSQSIDDLEKPFSSPLFYSEEIQEKPKRRICPNCNLIYERSTFCIRCGSSLVEELPMEEKKSGEIKPQEEIKEEKREPISLAIKKDKFLQKEEIQRKGKKETLAVDSKKKPSFVQKPIEREGEIPSFSDEEGLWEIETSEKILEKKTITQILKELRFPKKGIKKIRGISFQMVSIVILIVAVGYLLWSIYSLISPKQPKPDIPASKEYLSLIPPKSPSSKPPVSTSEPKEMNGKQQEESPPVSKEGLTLPPSPQKPYSEIGEIEDIKNLLETIRRANLQKDIDLFMSCYSSDFKDREGKKKSTLENWKSFNYLDLYYDLKKHSLSENKASIRVEWRIQFSSKSVSQPQESKSILDVILKKEFGSWKIKEILPIS